MCLIRRKESRRWGIPKGFVDRGDSHEDTALNEAWEEAGLKGRVIGEPVGTYEYRKWKRTLAVVVYVIEVLDQESEWEESHFRERRWTSLTEAMSLLVDHPVHRLLDRASRLLAET